MFFDRTASWKNPWDVVSYASRCSYPCEAISCPCWAASRTRCGYFWAIQPIKQQVALALDSSRMARSLAKLLATREGRESQDAIFGVVGKSRMWNQSSTSI